MKSLLISIVLFLPFSAFTQSHRVVVLREAAYAACEEILRNQQPIFEGCNEDGEPINLKATQKRMVLGCADSGKLYVKALIGKAGTVIAYQVVKSSSEGLEREFLKRIDQLKFKRECPDVMPACLWVTIPMVFRCQN